MAPIVFALASSRKSRSCCDKPFTLCKTCSRVKANMDVSVPISGEKPGCGPTIHSFSAPATDDGKTPKVESPKASPRLPFRKWRRLELHSTGNIELASVGDAISWGIILLSEQSCEASTQVL